MILLTNIQILNLLQVYIAIHYILNMQAKTLKCDQWTLFIPSLHYHCNVIQA